MKKILPVVIILLVLLAGVGGYLILNKKTVTSTGISKAPEQNNVISSIKDALAKSVSFSCDFTDETGRHVVSYVKNGAVRADFTSKNPDETGSTLMKDKKVYFWNSKTAIVMTLPEVTPGVQQNTQDKAQSTQDEVINNMEKYKASCKPTIVADSIFAVPSDIKFTDLSQMMVPPTGTMMPSGDQQIDYQQLMQQYGQQ